MTLRKGPIFGARHLQTLLLFLAIVINFASRIHIAVSLLAMTDAKTTNHNFHEFDWNEQEKSYILSSFFWGYTISQIPGGLAARRFGVKAIILIGSFTCAILGISVPFCVFWGGWQILCIIRVLQGLCQGVLLPCVYQHLSKWSPVEERNRLGALIFLGPDCATIVAMYVTGIIAASDLGWPGIFYIFSGCGVVFSFIWLILAENTPADAKFITAAERSYILTSQTSSGGLLNTQEKKKNIPVPWKAILTSVPFISFLLVRICDYWGISTMQAQIPSYLHGTLKMDITNSGFYSALPYVTTVLLSFAYMISADVILKNKWTSLLVVRKTFNTIAMWSSAALLIGMGFLNENHRALAISFMTLSVGLSSGSVIGSVLNLIDLSPNHSGILMAFANTLGSTVYFVCPLVVGIIVNDATDRSQWQIVFLISGGLYFLGNLQFLFFAQTDIQPWNEEDFEIKKDIKRGTKMSKSSSYSLVNVEP